MIENSIVYRDFKGKYQYLPISRAEGSRIWDKEGKEYIDFTSGWNVTNLGWNHPEIAEAVIAQTKKNVQGLLWGSDPIQEEYARALTAALPKELDACSKATGGTEAIEMAMKVARVFTGRRKVLGFNQHYHGQLFASLALGATADTRGRLNPLVPEITPIEFPDEHLGKEGFDAFADRLAALLSEEDIAAVVTEPGIVTGWGSTRIAYPGFLKRLRELTEKYGTLLVVDEVGTGFSRTGKLFGIEHESVVPDLVVFAKAMSNGAAAIGTAVGKSAIFEQAFSEAVLISTFGWTPIACAAALKTLEVHRRDRMWEATERKGRYMVERLKKLVGGPVTEVRGQGLEIGLRFANAELCQKVQQASFTNGLHVVVGSQENMQIMPPLTISQDLIDKGLDILEAQVEKL